MIARKLGWLAVEISLLALWIRFGSGAALLLAAALILIPLFSIPMNLYLRKRISLKLTAEPNLRKGSVGGAVLELEHPPMLPVFLGCTLVTENLLNGMTHHVRLAFSETRVTAAVKSDFCGRLRLTVEKAKLYDCFALVGIPVDLRKKCHITVQPEGFDTDISLVDDMGSTAESEQYSPWRSGCDLTETFQLREYIPGDSPRQIHWKLSGKLDRLIIREPGLPVVQDVLLFWERTGEAASLECTDAQAEAVVSIGRALLNQSIPFRLGWNDGAENRCILHDIRELDDLIAVLPRLLSAAGGQPGHPGAALLMQTRPDALCSHMVYVANTPAPQVTDWQSFGRLTILTTSDGCSGAIRFDETNYPARLGQLEL